MTIFSNAVLYSIFIYLISCFIIVFAFFKWSFSYWARNGLEALTPIIPLGNILEMMTMKANFGEQIQSIYTKLKAKGLRHGGMYLFIRPVYIPIDPTIIKNILKTDFQHFMNHGSYFDKNVDPLSGHLFNLNDNEWKRLRSKLTPAFTSGKMKIMFQTIKDCTEGLKEIMCENAKNQTPLEIKDVFSRFTADIIGSCIFGLQCNCLKERDSEFYKHGKRFFENTPPEALRGLIAFALPPKWLRLFKIKITKPDVEEFFLEIVRDSVNYRETNHIFCKDFFHLLLQLKNKGEVGDDESITAEKDQIGGMTVEEMAAQVHVFFVAGYETTSATITFALYELAKNQEIQNKLRKEIQMVLSKYDNEISYEAIMKMEYLKKVINETLRKYPPFPVMFRICGKDYPLADTSFIIKKETLVLISTLGIHSDPQFYPNPNNFDPERFNEEGKKNRIPCTWMPFGEGPRICIGLRFGSPLTKLCLTTLIKDYKMTLNDKTKTPLIMEKLGIVTTAEGGIWLNIDKI